MYPTKRMYSNIKIITKKQQFQKNDNIIYIKNDYFKKGIVKDVHYDDEIPYYTIEINGNEIQTIEKYLKLYN